MTTYSDLISRDASNDPLVPTPVSADVIQVAAHASAVQSLARRAPMTSKSGRQPVLSTLPTAYFVSGDTGMKQTTSADWENLELVAEEIACIVPVPEAYLDDSQVPIWDNVAPLAAQAIGKTFDNAALWGTNKPSTWGAALSTSIEASNNDFTEGVSGDDFAADLAYVGEAIAKDGFGITGFITRPGTQWRLMSLRSTTGEPIYTQSLANGGGQGLYGYSLNEVMNGAWDNDYTIVAGDWTKAVVGYRQEISWRIFTEGVISDDSGNVVLNLMQQDSVAMRFVARYGWAVADPVTPTSGQSDANTFPFGAVVSQPT